MGFFGQIEGPIKDVMQVLVTDEGLAFPITYRRWDSQSFDETERCMVEKYTNLPVNAIQLRHSKETQLASTSEVEIGDILYMFKGGDLPEASLSLKDKIIAYDGSKYDVKGIDHIFGLALSVTVKGG